MIFFENFTRNYMCNWMDAFNNRWKKQFAWKLIQNTYKVPFAWRKKQPNKTKLYLTLRSRSCDTKKTPLCWVSVSSSDQAQGNIHVLN